VPFRQLEYNMYRYVRPIISVVSEIVTVQMILAATLHLSTNNVRMHRRLQSRLP